MKSRPWLMYMEQVTITDADTPVARLRVTLRRRKYDG